MLVMVRVSRCPWLAVVKPPHPTPPHRTPLYPTRTVRQQRGAVSPIIHEVALGDDTHRSLAGRVDLGRVREGRGGGRAAVDATPWVERELNYLLRKFKGLRVGDVLCRWHHRQDDGVRVADEAEAQLPYQHLRRKQGRRERTW